MIQPPDRSGEFQCLDCGAEHSYTKCPFCGGRARRATQPSNETQPPERDRLKVLAAARQKAYDLLVYDAGMSDEEEGLPTATINAVAATLLAWGHKERVAGLREAQAELPGVSPLIERELLYDVLEKRINALEAERKEIQHDPTA